MGLQCNWIYVLESWSNLLWTRSRDQVVLARFKPCMQDGHMANKGETFFCASHDQVALTICSGIESSKSFLSSWLVHSNQSQPIPICTYYVRNPREQIVRATMYSSLWERERAYVPWVILYHSLFSFPFKTSIAWEGIIQTLHMTFEWFLVIDWCWKSLEK